MRNKITTVTLKEMKQRGDKITALTAYDASTAALLDEAGIEVILVGDSVANVKLGYENTLPVTMEEMLHHTKAVKRGCKRALLVADMPYLSYELTPLEAARNAGRMIKEGGAEAVKLEGAGNMLEAVKKIIAANIPVMGHLGLTPQSIYRFGGYKVQGTNQESAETILEDAIALEAAGIFALVLEGIPYDLARKITEKLSIPTIGIGAGCQCDGQILVSDDMLGLTPGKIPKFVKKYANLREESLKAVSAFTREVKSGQFPGPEHTY